MRVVVSTIHSLRSLLDHRGSIRSLLDHLGAGLAAAVLMAAMLVPAPASATTTLDVPGPGRGQWQIGQLWHGPALGGTRVPAGTAIDLNPTDTDRLDVYAIGAGKIVGTCVSPTQTYVLVDTVGIGIVGYVHLATGTVKSSGYVAQGQRLGSLATRWVKSVCATSWTGPHLHLAFPRTYDVLELSGQTVKRFAYLNFSYSPPPTRFLGHVSARLTLTRSASRLLVCSDNLAGNVVTARLNRLRTKTSSGRTWSVSKLATARCLGFGDLDGSLHTVAGRTYVVRAALNATPSLSWNAAGCYQQTVGRGMCSTALLNKRQ